MQTPDHSLFISMGIFYEIPNMQYIQISKVFAGRQLAMQWAEF
jgi:hypothetical protein